ncbi:MAG: sugar nucleotide-binding protein [Nanoarchaeota archaeon]|nr:sugar nucleotide-binding protein [Nanoarchaeota archaeon]
MILDKAKSGIYHLTNSGTCNWEIFSKKIFKVLNINCKIKLISFSKYKRNVKTPKNGILVNTKIYKLPSWENAIERYLDEKNEIKN